jgi:uncharacterized membrane protein YidH (DUF202 family)
MQYEFSIGSFFLGLVILIAGAAFTRWYQVIADNLGSGVASYDRFRLWALIACGVGFIVMLNLHTLILGWFFSLLFPGN